jgi:hypothetical protein
VAKGCLEVASDTLGVVLDAGRTRVAEAVDQVCGRHSGEEGRMTPRGSGMK